MMRIPETGQESASQAVKNSAVISTLSTLGFVSSLIVDIAVAAQFGLGSATDAFFVAFTIPRLSASMLRVAIRSVMVPAFSEKIVEEGKPGLWRASSTLINLSLVALGVLAAVGSLGAPLLIRVLGAGLDDSARNLAVSLCRIMFWMVVPLGVSEVVNATLNSLRNFGPPAATQLVWNSPVLLGILLYSQSEGIRSLAFGYVIGAWIQLALVVAVLLIKGFQYHPTLRWQEPWTKEVLRKIRHPLAAAVLGQSNLVLERFLASFLPVGLVSALAYARRTYGAMDAIFLGSVSTAFLPRLSTQFKQNAMPAFKRSLSLGLKFTVFISAPLTIGIIALSEPIVQTLFQRGAFDSETTRTTARLLSLYILSIPPMALRKMLIAGFYAAMDVKTPFYVAAAMLGLNTVLDFVLLDVMGVFGLALAVPLTRMITTALLIWLLYRRIGSFGPGLFAFAVRISLAAAIMGIILLGLQGLVFGHLKRGGSFGAILQLFAGTAAGIAVYALSLLAFRVKEFEEVARIVRGRFNRGKIHTMSG
jgi:putative peptidoglycan lipid II flippase